MHGKQCERKAFRHANLRAIKCDVGRAGILVTHRPTNRQRAHCIVMVWDRFQGLLWITWKLAEADLHVSAAVQNPFPAFWMAYMSQWELSRRDW